MKKYQTYFIVILLLSLVPMGVSLAASKGEMPDMEEAALPVKKESTLFQMQGCPGTKDLDEISQEQRDAVESFFKEASKKAIVGFFQEKCSIFGVYKEENLGNQDKIVKLYMAAEQEADRLLKENLEAKAFKRKMIEEGSVFLYLQGRKEVMSLMSNRMKGLTFEVGKTKKNMKEAQEKRLEYAKLLVELQEEVQAQVNPVSSFTESIQALSRLIPRCQEVSDQYESMVVCIEKKFSQLEKGGDVMKNKAIVEESTLKQLEIARGKNQEIIKGLPLLPPYYQLVKESQTIYHHSQELRNKNEKKMQRAVKRIEEIRRFISEDRRKESWCKVEEEGL